MLVIMLLTRNLSTSRFAALTQLRLYMSRRYTATEMASGCRIKNANGGQRHRLNKRTYPCFVCGAERNTLVVHITANGCPLQGQGSGCSAYVGGNTSTELFQRHSSMISSNKCVQRYCALLLADVIRMYACCCWSSLKARS